MKICPLPLLAIALAANTAIFAQQRSFTALDEQNASTFNNDCAHSYQRLLRVFTLHAMNLSQGMQKISD
jgi:hypothetical protein